MTTTASCPIPPAVLNARATLIGPTLVYTCANGFRMSGGSGSRTCSNNTWSGSPPVCSLINTKSVIKNSFLGNSHVPWWVPVLFATFFGVLLLCCLLLFCISYCCGYRLPCHRCCRCPSLTSRRRRGSYDSEDIGGVYILPHGNNSRRQLNAPRRNIIIHDQSNKQAFHESPDTQRVRVKNEYFTRLPNGDLIPHTKPTAYRPPKHAVLEEHYLRLPNGELVRVDKKDVKNYKNTTRHTTSNSPSLYDSNQNMHHSTPARNKRSHNLTFSDDGLVPVDSPYDSKSYNIVDRVVETNRTQQAKELKQWMPHTKAVRDINTSTK
ncbi:uncharacterized protein LOC121369394 [Gigantopelta aegis]|uniref:uncharacterized protein LOC121369394 n=1 Tax=Gigantopelta aegis TaxID=1735272 RepID=UPI001B8894B1|nr:uncharacterized protein LOC121369394 [Gigantopelta aegis]